MIGKQALRLRWHEASLRDRGPAPKATPLMRSAISSRALRRDAKTPPFACL